MTDDASPPKDVIYSRFWEEEAEPDNPFAAKACYCHGYDVYGDILSKASWVEYLYLLFMGSRPTASQTQLLEKLAIVLANPGPRDLSVRAAMNGTVGTATNPSALMAAISVGSGHMQGSREVVRAMDYWNTCQTDLAKWEAALHALPCEERLDIWKKLEHSPGFDPYNNQCATPVKQALDVLASIGEGWALAWLHQNRAQLETIAGYPLAMSGVAAAALVDLGCSNLKDKEYHHAKAEMLYLFLRLPGAAVHALEQTQYGMAKFPFFREGLDLLPYPE